MRFGLLGPLLVAEGDRQLTVPGPRQRVLLAALALRAGQAVAADELAELVWDSDPPSGAAGALRTQVMRLRRLLGPEVGERVVTHYPGYLLAAGDDEVDVACFAQGCQRGGTLAREGSWPEAAAALGEALALWRGPALADIPSETLRREEVPRLERLRCQALEWHLEAGLALGRHAELVEQARSLAAAEPLRERFHAQLMLALYRCGRQAEALAVYASARGVLVAELGTEPGPELRDLQHRILSCDPSLNPVPAGGAVAAGEALAEPDRPGVAEPDQATGGAERAHSPREHSVTVPRELPAPVAYFTGRDAELAELDQLLAEAVSPATGAGSVLVAVIAGTAGVGKSALALRWAHRVADAFCDGQLYINLRGYDPAEPMAPADALAGFLRALGVPGPEIPAGTEERAARYRSLLAGRRMLILIDNAGDVEQVRPLLPGTPGCAVVVTSRDALSGLIARDGATRLDLDLLPVTEAIGLLRALIGDRAEADPDAARTLAHQCARLPLALRVAAEFAATRPSVPLSDLTGELACHQRRLELLDAGGDLRAAVRAVFSWSYQRLAPASARAFRMLGLHPGTAADAYAIAALTDGTLAEASQALHALTRAYLVQPSGHGHYTTHDLLRAYATGLTLAHDSDADRRDAQTRLFDHYRATAATAMDTLFPAHAHQRPPCPGPSTPPPPVTDPAGARAWLEAEAANLVAVTGHAAEHGWPAHATEFAILLWRYLEGAGHIPELAAISDHARRAAQLTGDRAAEAQILIQSTAVDLRQGRYHTAASSLQRALALHEAAGDRTGQGRALVNLGRLELLRGRYQQATGYLQRSLTLSRELGDRVAEARVLVNLSLIDRRQGRYTQAVRRLLAARDLFHDVRDAEGEGDALANLGFIHAQHGRHKRALSYLRPALALFRERADPVGEAYALVALSLAERTDGNTARATGHARRALGLFRETGDRAGEAEALGCLGEVLLAGGQQAEARNEFASELAVATQIGDKYAQAHAHYGLARGHDPEGDPAHASRHWLRAQEMYGSLGTPEAAEIRAVLASGEAAAAGLDRAREADHT